MPEARIRRPRVVFLTSVHQAFDPRILFREAASLAAAGFEVHLVAQHDRDELVQGVTIHGVRPLRGHGRGARGWTRLALHLRLARTAERLEPEVIHFHDPDLIPAVRVLRRKTGCRVIYDRHEDYGVRPGMEGRLLRRLEAWAFRWVDHVVVAEQAYVEPLRNKGIAATPILNYYQPVPGMEVRPDTGSDTRWTIVYSGVQSLERGSGTLIEVARRARTEGLPWLFRLVGPCYRTSDRFTLDRRIVSESLDAVVHRVGWNRYVPYPELLAWTARAQVGVALLHPRADYLQSVPTKFYEYASLGIPFVCSNFPLWERFVERHGCGAVVDPADPDAVFERLLSWYRDGVRYERARQACLAAAPAFSWSRMERPLRAVYEELVGDAVR